MEEDIIDIGGAVVCDLCNADYTDSEEVGGALIGSYAVCPVCAPEMVWNAQQNDEPIDALCPPDKSFKEWVLGLRRGDNTIRISAF